MYKVSLFVFVKIFSKNKKHVVSDKKLFDAKYETDNHVKLVRIVNNKKKQSYIVSMFNADDVETSINMKTANRLINDFRNIPADKEVHVIIHTLGGDLSAAEIIARLISRHKGKVTAIVPNYAYSGGTIIAFAYDEIITSESSVFGPVDPQMIFPANSIISAVKSHGKFAIEQLFKIESEKAVEDVKKLLKDTVKFKNEENRDEQINKIISDLVDGDLLHGHPIFCDRLISYGMNIKVDNELTNKLCQDLELVL